MFFMIMIYLKYYFTQFNFVFYTLILQFNYLFNFDVIYDMSIVFYRILYLIKMNFYSYTTMLH